MNAETDKSESKWHGIIFQRYLKTCSEIVSDSLDINSENLI